MDCTITPVVSLIVALVSVALNIVILGKVKNVLREVEQPVARKLTPDMNLRSVRSSQRGAPASAPASSAAPGAGVPSQGGEGGDRGRRGGRGRDRDGRSSEGRGDRGPRREGGEGRSDRGPRREGGEGAGDAGPRRRNRFEAPTEVVSNEDERKVEGAPASSVPLASAPEARVSEPRYSEEAPRSSRPALPTRGGDRSEPAPVAAPAVASEGGAPAASQEAPAAEGEARNIRHGRRSQVKRIPGMDE
jgi:hypothetical protein